ncbi:hypothetical protein [Mesorhizobium sp. BH1-1-4]|uniref:hypothetical protein n=1 Tax=Mesorhizobium sp. BH1-1-4 TaxID=2876662 RepID=UPI001CD0CEF0|nr:hypothetical protein [Mesorhizobium sp. BH1-1-4]MBZ9993067.1 hypothetical protein [Mesorhizobium sp. BH1-1-4]
MIAILTIETTHFHVFDGQEVAINPIRLIEATSAGVAHLAAGIVFFAMEIQVLTTGAAIRHVAPGRLVRLLSDF